MAVKYMVNPIFKAEEYGFPMEIPEERIGSKTLKHHDSPKTPYQRILESPHIPLSVKQLLSKQLEKLNPFVLREAMERKLRNILSPRLQSPSRQRSLR